MKKKFVLLMCLIPSLCFAKIERVETIDDGGTGAYKAIAVTESTLKDYVIYRPKNIALAAEKEGPLAVMVFANGGCNDTSFPFKRMLSEIASKGYLVIALGSMQNSLDDRPLKKAPNEMMPQAVDWLASQQMNKESEYFQTVDINKIAFAGQSCGGAQLLAVAADPRIKTYMMFNSGMGDMSMAAASRSSLPTLHTPIIYLVGGESDIATSNAELDYDRINHVPIAFANMLDGGHSGTYESPYGGSFTRMALKWLDWQLKQKNKNSQVFLENNLEEFDGWTMKAKHFIGS